MQPLPNLKAERFAQFCAAGTPVAEAYEKAGYAPNPNNARRLRAKEAVKTRIEALMREASDRALDENTRVIREIGYSKVDAMAEAQSALHLAVSTKNASAAVAAVKLRAQLNNLLVERREVTKPSEFETAEQLEACLIEAVMLTGFTREQAERIVREGTDPRSISKPQ
jgi:hypothetical protein